MVLHAQHLPVSTTSNPSRNKHETDAANHTSDIRAFRHGASVVHVDIVSRLLLSWTHEMHFAILVDLGRDWSKIVFKMGNHLIAKLAFFPPDPPNYTEKGAADDTDPPSTFKSSNLAGHGLPCLFTSCFRVPNADVTAFVTTALGQTIPILHIKHRS